MTATLDIPAAPVAPAEKKSGVLALLRSVGAMFLPVIAYQVGDYLAAHWEPARQLEHALAPYAFSASLLVGLAVGLVQFVWTYSKTRELSSYVLQQLAWLLAFTFIPLYFGHFVHQTASDPVGYNVLGLVAMGVGASYFVDFLLGSRLMMAFPKHFNPETAKFAGNPGFQRIISHVELGMVLMFVLKGSFLVFGNRLLPKATYLLLLPFVAKGLIFGFMAFAIGYPQWARRRYKQQQAVAA